MPKILQGIQINVVTHRNDFGPFDKPVFHVFVKNRRSDTSWPESNTDFLSNKLAYDAVQAAAPGPFDLNPYLGSKQSVPVLNPGGTQTVDIDLRNQEILPGEAILPVVNIHLHWPGPGLWAFNYTITFSFDDGPPVTYSPSDDGIASILLDTINKDYSGICREVYTPPAPARPFSEPVYLTEVRLDFGTHGDDKAADTAINVHIANRLSATSSQDIGIGVGLFKGYPFPQPDGTGFPGDMSLFFGSGGDPYNSLQLSSDSIQLQDIVLPVVYITIAPTGDDRWIFSYRVTYSFSNGEVFSSTTNNVSLDRDSNKHAGVYNGTPFPTYPAAGTAPSYWTEVREQKKISLGFVGTKISELLSNRGFPIFKFRFGNIEGESYYDVQTVSPLPPPPGALSVPGWTEGVQWSSSPTSLGFLDNAAAFPTVNSTSFTISVNGKDHLLPITMLANFETGWAMPYDPGTGLTTMTVNTFWIQIKGTLLLDPDNQKVDILRWVHDINSLKWAPGGVGYTYEGEFLGQPISGNLAITEKEGFIDSLIQQGLIVRFNTDNATDLGGAFEKRMRQRIFQTLGTATPITEKSPADKINAYVNWWLLGGVTGTGKQCSVSSVSIATDNDTLEIDYTGHRYDLPAPLDWPAGVDFTPGALANIDHIIVLTKENHSFDSMLGYLSLPVDAGGQGRSDVDGLKGGEMNMLDGEPYPSFAFPPYDTVFSPDPPQDSQRTLKQINNGAMDGFVRAYADQNGRQVAPRIMGYYNAATVPVYDALTRDFAICHRWFAPHPGPTFPNRFYELAGRLNITPDERWYMDNSIQMPEFDYASPVLPAFALTIFDLLPQGVTWKYFEQRYCYLRLFADHTFDATNIVAFDDPENGFLALARQGNLPNVSFIDPSFIDLPPGGTCDEAPADVKEGQELVRQVVEAVVAGPQWDKTLLIITYDEHGGFFDHVPPPPAAKNTQESPGTYGPRVPTFIISPWVKGGSVVGNDGLCFDHTSILKTTARRFTSYYPLHPTGATPPYLGTRYASARDLSAVLTTSPRPSQFRPFIPYNLQYAQSQKGLEVELGSLVKGALLWQNDPDSAAAPQQFRFEDAGGGYWYLRTHTGNMYLTVNSALQITQDVKHYGGAANSQRWKFTSGILVGSGYTITSAAYPGKTLQPLGNSTASNAPVVVGDPESLPVGTHVANPWNVTSPTLGPGPGLHP